MTTQNTPLLNLFGLQKMQPGAEGETGQRFYNRDSFKNLAANLAIGLNSMRLNPDASLPQRMQAQIAQRQQNRTRNRTVEALRKRAEGGDKLAAKYLGAIESGALPVAQAMSAYMQEGAQIAAEGRAAARAAARPSALQEKINAAIEAGFPKGSPEYNKIVLGLDTPKDDSTIIKGADGYNYYVGGEKDGQRVLADVVKPQALSAMQEKQQLLKAAGIEPGSNQYNKAMFGITPEKETSLEEKSRLLIAAGIEVGTPEYNQALFNITPDKKTAFEEKKNALIAAGFEQGSEGYNQALFNIRKQPLSAFEEKRAALLDAGIKVGTPEYNEALFSISAKDPKNASLVTLISTTPVTINGKTYAANVPFSLDEASQQAQINEATAQGAIEAPTVTQTLTDPEDVPTVDEVLAAANANPDVPSIDIEIGAGGDLAGTAVDLGNAVAGFITGGSVSEEREKQVATINALNNSIKASLVRELSKAGSNYTQKQIEKLLPTPNLTNEKFMQRAEALFPKLKDDLANQLWLSGNAKTPKGRNDAKREADLINVYITSMTLAIDKYRRSNSGGGGSLQDQADAILGSSK